MEPFIPTSLPCLLRNDSSLSLCSYKNARFPSFPSDNSTLGAARSIIEITDGSKDLMGEHRTLYASFNLAFIIFHQSDWGTTRAWKGTIRNGGSIRSKYSGKLRKKTFRGSALRSITRELMDTIDAKVWTYGGRRGEDSVHFFEVLSSTHREINVAWTAT